MDIFDKSVELGVKDVNFNNNIRLNKRFLRVMDDCMHKYGSSFLTISGNRNNAKAVYRMFSNDDFSYNDILKSHINSSLDYINKNDLREILILHDTSSVNLNEHKKTDGLGICYGGDNTLGLSVHSSLATETTGVSFGLLNQIISTRPIDEQLKYLSKDAKKKNAKSKENKPIDNKESVRWLDGISASQAHVPNDVKAIHICDREGDIYELFDLANSTNTSFIIRAIHNRKDMDGQYTIDKVKSSKIVGEMTVNIPRNTRDNIPSRTTILVIRYVEVDIKKPAKKQSNSELNASNKATIIYVTEKETARKNDGGRIAPIEWFLLTNEEVLNYEDAFKIVEYYVHRWKIERFHFVLKSGCKIEELQLRTVEKLESAILMFSIIAIRVVNITYIARVSPERSCECILSEDEWKILYSVANMTKEKPDKPYTVKEAVMYLSTLGGYKRAPSDGLPGLETVWRGIVKLQVLVDYGKYL